MSGLGRSALSADGGRRCDKWRNARRERCRHVDAEIGGSDWGRTHLTFRGTRGGQQVTHDTSVSVRRPTMGVHNSHRVRDDQAFGA